MSIWGIEPYDWFKSRLFMDIVPFSMARDFSGDWYSDVPRQFEQMRRRMERMFDETKIPKDLIKEYQTSEGTKVHEVGPDGRPRVKEFGNAKSLFGRRGISGADAATIGKPLATGETEPLSDITTIDKEVKVVVEMPGIDKKDIKINAYDNSVEISTANTARRKYRSVIELPSEADAETVKSTYNNGILEITFKKKEQNILHSIYSKYNDDSEEKSNLKFSKEVLRCLIINRR